MKEGVLSIDPKDISQSKLHGYLLAAIAPRPICFASTIGKNGDVNLSPFSFFNVFSSNPPILIFSPARRGRDNTIKHTLENVREVKEVVINIVNHAIVEQMSLSSTEYPRGVNEFLKSGLTPLKSEMVRPPRVAESPVSMECRVNKIESLGNGPGAGNLVICEVLKMHIQKQYLDDTKSLDTRKLELVGRMGDSWYTKAFENALFEIPKPLKTKGIGVDSLPDSIKMSNILTGNNLGRLGNLEKSPSTNHINELRDDQYVYSIISNAEKSIESRITALHSHAKELIEENNSELALRVLFLADRMA